MILGVGWGNGSGTVPVFTSYARKSFGWAIGEAEKTENGDILRLKRWRAGATTDVSITLPANVRGSYTETAPFGCPKSAAILANARNLLYAVDSAFLCALCGVVLAVTFLATPGRAGFWC